MQAILSCSGGKLCDPIGPMISREDGGNLWVMPPREVWDRRELTRDELIQWSFLVAASGSAMLDVLPQLKDGVINYWEAGNWGLNEEAEPKGQKIGHIHKKVHMHLLGRNPNAQDKDWQWGEAPIFPTFRDSDAWRATKENLTSDECNAVAARTAEILVEKYGVDASDIQIIKRS